MRTLLGLLLCVCALSAALRTRQEAVRDRDQERDVRTLRDTIQNLRDPYFQPRHEYRYVYRGQLATGLPQESEQMATTRLEAQVSLMFPREQETAVMRLTQIRFGNLNGELPEPREILDFEAFEPKELEQDQMRVLELPIRFRYVNGMISEIEFDREDHGWSENVKRGILNMLQLNMKRDRRTDTREEGHEFNTKEERNMEEREERRAEREHDDFFTVHERTLEGVCDTTYTINRQKPQTETERVTRITKSINYERCTQRINLRYNHRFADVCSKCEQRYEREEALAPSTVINYRILGDANRFLIRDVDLRSQYVLTPVGPNDVAMKTFVVCQLQLVEVRDQVRDLREPQSEHRETLMYAPKRTIEIERFFKEGEEALTRDHPYRQFKNKHVLAEQMMRRLIKETEDREQGIQVEATHQFARLVDLLRTCSKDELRRIHRDLWEDKERKFDEKTQKKVRDLMVDALAIAGTEIPIEHLIEKIEQGQVGTTKASIAIRQLMNSVVVSERQIEMVMNLAKKDVCRRSPTLRQSCLLTASGMISALCMPNKDVHSMDLKTERCPRPMKERFLRQLVEYYRTANDRYEKILALKMLGNAGLDLSVYELEKIIVDRHEERVIRVQAIDALRQLRHAMPRKIQRILLPIFKDITEHPEVRMTALVRIMQTLPERSILDQLAQALFREPSRHVKTFAFTMMRTLSESKNPCEKRLAEDLKISLTMAKVELNRWTDSRFMHMPMYSEERRTGLTVDWATVFSNDGVLPRETMLNLDSLLFGQWHKTMAQFGIMQYNFDHIIEDMWRDTRSEETEEEDTVVRGRRTNPLEPRQLLRNLFERLNIRNRRERQQKPFVMVYMRHGDLDCTFIPLDFENLPEFLKNERDGRMDVQKLLTEAKRGYHIDTHLGYYIRESYHKIPTTLGIPIHYCSKMPMIARLTGDLKLEMNTRDMRSLKVHVDMRPSVAVTHIIDAFLVFPVLSQRPKMIQTIRMNIPLRGSIELNMEDREKTRMNVVLRVPEEKTQVLVLQSRFVTSTFAWKRDTRTYIEPLEKTVHFRDQHRRLQTFDRIMGENLMGVRVHMRGQWHENPLKAFQRSPMALLAAQNEFEITIEKGEDAPREIVARIEIETPRTERMERPQVEKFYTEEDHHERRHLDVEREIVKRREDREHENEREHKRTYEREERERREELKKYIREIAIENGYKVRMVMKLETIGARNQKKAELKVDTGCDDNLRHCVLEMEVRRSPMFENERREWTMKTKMVALLPRDIDNVKELTERNLLIVRQFNAYVQCEYGNERRHHINLKIRGEQSPEQRRLVERLINKRTEVEGRELVEDWKLLEATKLNQFKVVVDYKITEYMKEYFEEVLAMLRAYNVMNTHVQETRNAENRLFAHALIDPRTCDLVNIGVHTPERVVEIEDIALPIKMTPFRMTRHDHRNYAPVRSFMDLIREPFYEERAECEVEKRMVKTFDDVQMRLPMTTCYSVLAKDCRSERPHFAVLMRKLTKRADEMKMKVIDLEHVYELEPVRDEIKVKVDGRVVEDEERLREFGVERSDKMMVVVCLREVTVRFDGRKAWIKMSPIFKNGQCGICGHYDDEKRFELRRADNELARDVQEYHRSYLNTEEECEMEEDILREEENYELRDEMREREHEREPQWEQEREVRKPVMKTRVIEREENVCFSKQPVAECERETYARDEDKVEKHVQFTCVPRRQYETMEMLRRVNDDVIDMNERKTSFTETLRVPKTCVVF